MVKTTKLPKSRNVTVAPTRLDLGCGPRKKEGFYGVDAISFPNVDCVMDLKGEWPWSNDSIEEVHSSHFIEHLTAMERVHFYNELCRVMKKGAKAALVVPHWSSCRAYGDPTHQWPPVSEFSLFYIRKEWRMQNAPHTDGDHLKGGFTCDFDASWGFTLDPATLSRNQEYQQFAMQYYTEARQDMIVNMVKR